MSEGRRTARQTAGPDIDPRRIAALRMLSRTMLLLVVLEAGLVLIGWWLDVEALKSMLPRRVAMNPLTALGFLLAAASLRPPEQGAPVSVRGTWIRRAVRIGAAGVVAIGAVTAIGYAIGTSLGLDQVMFRTRLGGSRIAPNTALNFILIGVALLLLDWEPRRGSRPAQLVALLPTAIALTSILGYVYGVGELYGMARYIPMALPTAIAFLALGIAILCARPDRGLMAVIASDHAGGVLARRLLPAAVVIPALLSWLRILGQRAGLFGAELGLALVATSNIFVFAALIGITARFLDRADRRRQAGERRLATQYATTRILVESATFEEAIPKILRTVAESLDWVTGVRWAVDREAGVLRCAEMWTAPPRTLAAVRRDQPADRVSGRASGCRDASGARGARRGSPT